MQYFESCFAFNNSIEKPDNLTQNPHFTWEREPRIELHSSFKFFLLVYQKHSDFFKDTKQTNVVDKQYLYIGQKENTDYAD